MKPLGLYLHIPFCLSKCKYCDFYSVPGANPSLTDRYVNALISHMSEYSIQAKGHVVNTIYFGGGTPSLLSEQQMKLIMKKLRSLFKIHPLAEITMEMNPATAGVEKLKLMHKLGINRLSIGVQSFNDADLKVCGRSHSAEDAYNTISLARSAGFSNISIDLMYGIPKQSLQSVVDNINTAIRLDIKHISLYGLKIEDGTPFWFDRHKLALPDEDTERSMYFTSAGLLANAGYEQYEISNFAMKGKRSKHNLRYWNCEEYLGFGPAAHSYFGGKRFSFKRNINLYMDSFDNANNVNETLLDEYIDIPYSSRVAEYVMLRFRLKTGINTEIFKSKFGRNFDDLYSERMAPYIKSGHIIKTKTGYAFSPEGMYVSNYILSRLIDFDLLIPGN